MQDLIIDRVLQSRSFAVIGASRDPEKYGYLVYRSLKESGKLVYPVNPKAREIDSDPCYGSLSSLPELPDVAVFVVPPAVTEATIPECARLGIKLVWMQEGAESGEAVRRCEEAEIGVVWGGPCVMVALRTHGLWKKREATTSQL